MMSAQAKTIIGVSRLLQRDALHSSPCQWVRLETFHNQYFQGKKKKKTATCQITDTGCLREDSKGLFSHCGTWHVYARAVL